VALSERASKRGATIILFTDQWLSPIARWAKHVLPTRVVVPSHWDSSASILVLVETILAALTKRLWVTARGRMEEIEQLRAPVLPRL
jgi:DNA-binding MurR/RpiR family transcriptional regulator